MNLGFSLRNVSFESFFSVFGSATFQTLGNFTDCCRIIVQFDTQTNRPQGQNKMRDFFEIHSLKDFFYQFNNCPAFGFAVTVIFFCGLGVITTLIGLFVTL